MFTGLIQAVGQVTAVKQSVLELVADDLPGRGSLADGESIAVNGACLTLLKQDGSRELSFDVSPETFARTALGELKPGTQVNLERAMSASALLGGHIVQGHVDCTGELIEQGQSASFRVYRFQAPLEYDRYLIDKGSIAVDGVSLTVVQPFRGAFDVWLVPHTLEKTTMGQMEIGTRVNLEFDVLAKHVEKLLEARLSQTRDVA